MKKFSMYAVGWILSVCLLFVTNANAQITLPYFENFQTIPAANQFPVVAGGAWTRSGTTSNQPTYVTNQTSYNRSGNGDSYFITFQYASGTRYYFVGPFALQASQTYQTSVLYKADGAAGFGPLALTYGTDATAATQTNTIASVPANIINQPYLPLVGQFSPPADGNYYIAIKCTSNGGPWYLSLDDFSVLALPQCSGTPDAGTVTVSPATNVAGASYTVSATNYTQAIGLFFKWQTNTGGAGWVDAGSATTSYAAYSGTAPAFGTTVDHRLIVTCTTSSESDTSTVATFTSGYCAPTSASTYYLDTIITTGGITNLNYTASSFSANYTDNSATTFSQYNGASISVRLELASPGTDYYFCWVDWNNDGDFADAGETIFATTQYTTGYTGTIAIPANQTPGTYRVRFAASYAGAISACTGNTASNYADYSLVVVPLPACTGSPVAGTATVSPTENSSGASYTASATGYTQASGLSFQWQTNIGGAGWVNAGTATTSYAAYSGTAPATFGATVDHRLIVTCTASSESDTSTVATFTSGYCVPTSTASTNYWLSSISTTSGITNLAYTATSYSPYINSGQSFSQYPGLTVNVSVAINTSNAVYACWVDWNNDGDFSDAGETIYAGNSTYATTYAGQILVPATQALGAYRVRFAVGYFIPSPWDPCSSTLSGNYVDATITVVQLPACSGTPDAGTATVSPAETSAGTAYTASSTGYTQASGLLYLWQTNTGGAGWVDAGSATDAFVAYNGTAPAFGTTVDHRLIVTCTTSSESDTSSVAIFTTGYCYPASISGTYYLDTVKTTGGLTNLNYTATALTAGYIDNSATPSFSQLPGTDVSVRIHLSTTNTDYYYCWVDWNNDGDFGDANETVFATTSYSNGYTGTIHAPANAVAGTYRVRFAASELGAISACTGNGYSNYVDFSLIVIAPPACSGTPDAGTVVVTPVQNTPGASYSVAATGYTIATGLSFQWESNTDSAGWVAVGTSDSIYNDLSATAGSLGSTVQYRLITTCVSSAVSDTSNTVVFVASYCTPSAGSGSSFYYISAVTTTGGIENANYTAATYSPYVFSNSVFSQYPDSTVAIAVVGVSGTFTYSYIYAAWIDWNNDGDFYDAGETLYSTSGYTNPPYNDTLIIPSGQAPGNYRIRFAVSYLSLTWDPCGSIPSGNYVDLTLQVLTHAPIISSFTPAEGCSNTATVSIAGSNFTNVTAVTVGGTSVDAFTVVSDSVITATVGSGTTGVVTLATATDTISTTDVFTVNVPATTSQEFTLCSGDSVVVGSHTYNVSGIYYDTLQTSAGCDSIVTTTVNINSAINTSVSAIAATGSAALSGATYQWINCTTGEAVAGATSQSYTATVTGSYNVAIGLNNCTDTSDCITLVVDTSVTPPPACDTCPPTGINNVEWAKAVNIYPNPTSGVTTISIAHFTANDLNITISDMQGKVVYATERVITSSDFNTTIDLSGTAKGVYTVKLNTGSDIAVRQLILQ